MWKTLLAVDFDARACEVYRVNFPAVEVVCAKVSDMLGQLPKADVIIGGPPCQSFSTAGKGLGKDGGTNCWPEAIEAVRKVQPRMFLYENVAGMLNRKHIPYARQIFADLEACGYKVDAQVLDAVNYGVPQFRKRLFYWGIRADLYAQGMRHEWPKPTHVWPWPKAGMFASEMLPAVTVGQALGLDGQIGVPRNINERAGNKWHCADEPAITVDAVGEHAYRHSPAMLAKHPPAEPAEPAPTVQAKWFKGGAEGLVAVSVDPRHPVHSPDSPGNTLRSGGKGNGMPDCCQTVSADGRTWDSRHPIPGPEEPMPTMRPRGPRDGGRCTEQVIRDKQVVRRLRPDECLRLQSGPDDMAWPAGCTKTTKYRVIGNGVACGVANVLARQMQLADPESASILSLFCGGGLMDLGFHGRFWQY